MHNEQWSVHYGSNLSVGELEYFEKLIKVVKLKYEGWLIEVCAQFDPTLRIGARIHPQYKLVNLHKYRAFNKYEPFILATQTTQLFYSPYPSLTRSSNVWLMVYAIKARFVVEVA